VFDLSGRTALVTGAGRNVGAGIATALASAGARVAVNDYYSDRAETVAKAITDSGGEAAAVPGDVTDPATVRRMVDAAEQAVGPVDILVNNAGIPPEPGKWVVPFLKTSPEDWDPMIRLNLYAVLHCTHVCVAPMVERGWGRVVNIVSNAGRTGIPLTSAYAAGKAATIGFSRAIATELGGDGVTVNCLALGRVPAPGDDWQPPFATAATPIPRPGQPLDVAAAVVWLASPEGGWVTGQTVSVDGGHFMC
jgi:NAD(P)-dependent dehydrogenase (short-subunit alcohol dehydrogenase family)